MNQPRSLSPVPNPDVARPGSGFVDQTATRSLYVSRDPVNPSAIALRVNADESAQWILFTPHEARAVAVALDELAEEMLREAHR